MTDGASFMENIQNYDIPARKAILQYLVRMGSFTSAPKIPNEDRGDEDVEFPHSMTWKHLKQICEEKLSGHPETLPRALVTNHPICIGKEKVRIMQWNILGQGLADGSDVFVRCPKEALEWSIRRWRILEEIATFQPDILCMQEVDHFKFFEKAFSSMGYFGKFCPKPDSPCLYIPGNNGPDGCAIFINTTVFDILDTRTRTLEICTCQTNQVAIFSKIRRRSDGAELWIATTHLKAKPGIFMAGLRREQGCDLVSYMKCTVGEKTPFLLCGDLNAAPSEPVHDVLKSAGLESVYPNQEPAFTTWTVRDNGECAAILDYMLYSQGAFHVERILRMPTEEEIGFDRVPSYRYPSDHFSLVADLVLHNI